MECRQSDNKKSCSCTYDCERRGKCCECVMYHRSRKEFPGCFFSKKAEAIYDRSFSMLVKDRK